MMTERRKIKNGEYYALISATILFRTAFYMLMSGVPAWLASHTLAESGFGRFLLETFESPSQTFITVFYHLGIADFLLVLLLAVLIICWNFKGRQRFTKILSAAGTALFFVVMSRLFMILIYSPNGFVYMAVVQILEPVLVYIIPVGATIMTIFNIKQIGAYLKNALLKPTSVMFLAGGFVLIGGYIASVFIWEHIYTELLMSPATQKHEVQEHLIVRNYILVYLFGVKSLLICGTAMCYYRSVKEIKT
jgi:hypothetical protein